MRVSGPSGPAAGARGQTVSFREGSKLAELAFGSALKPPTPRVEVSPARGDVEIAVLSSVGSKGGRNDDDESSGATSVHQ